MRSKQVFARIVYVAVLAGSVRAEQVQVDITGAVESNQIGSGAFGVVSAGDAAHMSFLLDSDLFANDPSFPTRGYAIDHASYALTLGAASVGLQDPFSAGQTPLFGVRDNDPAVDGFFLATNTALPTGVPLDEAGGFGPFVSNFLVTYGGDALPSLNILDAVGTYDFTGLSVFNWTVSDGPFDPLLVVFEQMTISVVPEPSTLVLFGASVLLLRRRRSAVV